MKKEESLKAKTFSGLMWTFSEIVLNQGLQFIIQIVLARLLLPKEFGLIGIVTVFVAIANAIVDSGFTNALIREENPTQKDYSTVFYFNLLVGIVLYVLLYLLSPIISDFFIQPQLTQLIRVLSIVLIVNAFSIVQRVVLNRNLNFKLLMIINIISSLISGGLAILLAFNGFGIWSLAIRIVALQVIQTVLLISFNRWIPTITFSVESFKRLFGFGWKLLVSSIIDTTYNNLYYMIIGKIYTPTDLGYYTNAQKLRDVAVTSISNSIQKVTYPVLSKIQNDENILRESYRKVTKSAVYINFPIMLGLAVVGNKIIPILFGSDWAPSTPFFVILCVSGMLYPLQALNLNILQVKGRTDLFLKLEVAKKIISVILIAIAVIIQVGIIGLIWVMFINSVISFFINSHYSKKIINYSTWQQIKDITPVFIVTFISMGIVFFLGSFLYEPKIIFLIIEIISGIVIYIIFSYLFKLESLFMILEIIKKIIKK